MSSKSSKVKKLRKGDAMEESTVRMAFGYEFENADRKSYMAVRIMNIPGRNTLRTNSVEPSDSDEVVTLCIHVRSDLILSMRV